MCNVDQNTMLQLEKTVRQFLDEGRMFTAYDVTIETRTREKIRLHHREITGACHEIQCLRDAVDFGHDANGQTVHWKKTQVTMSNGIAAFVYHPEHLDANTYQAMTTQVSQISPVTTPALPMISTSMAIDNNLGNFRLDSSNRLLVPTMFLRSIGVNAGEIVTIAADDAKKSMVLIRDPGIFAGKYRVVNQKQVERNGHVRIRLETLTKANVNHTKFNIENIDVDVAGQQIPVVEITTP